MLISKESDMRANKHFFFSMSTLKSCYIVDRYICMIPSLRLWTNLWKRNKAKIRINRKMSRWHKKNFCAPAGGCLIFVLLFQQTTSWADNVSWRRRGKKLLCYLQTYIISAKLLEALDLNGIIGTGALSLFQNRNQLSLGVGACSRDVTVANNLIQRNNNKTTQKKIVHKWYTCKFYTS